VAHISTAQELELFEDNLNIEEKRITAEAVIAHLMFSN
jgi:dihydroorotase